MGYHNRAISRGFLCESAPVLMRSYILLIISQWFNVVAIQYGLAVCLIKITLLMLYRRVFSTHRGSMFDIAVISVIVVLSLFYGITTFFKIFECNPRAKIFNTSLPGTCFDISQILKTSGAFNTVSDFVILLLPLHAVSKLRMKKKKKVLVILVFTFGLWYVPIPLDVSLMSNRTFRQCARVCYYWICGPTTKKLQ